MNKDDLYWLISTSPAIQMLRLRNTHWILPFLYGVFKEENRFSISEVQLVRLLAETLGQQDDGTEDLEEAKINFGEDEETRARKYILNWVQKRLLQDLPDAEGNTQYQLSAYTEKVFQWMQTLQLRQHVGTESRFKLLFNSLRDIVENTEDDRAKKLEILKNKRADIDKEIKALELGIVPDRYNNAQVEERLELFTRLCYELISDFREVEDNFKAIHRTIVEQHTKAEQSKGAIIGFAFEAYDSLRNSNQGKSFYAFWDFLISRAGQEEWRELTDQLLHTITERKISGDEQFLQNIKSMLLQQGKTVYDANDKMAEKLSRIISEKEIARHRRLRKQINGIKEFVFDLIEEDDNIDCGITLDDSAGIRMVMEKKLALEQKKTIVDVKQPANATEQIEDVTRFSRLLNTSFISRKQLWEKVEHALKDKQTATLKEVLEHSPLENGLAEIISYYDFLREKASRAYIVKNTTELIPLNAEKTRFVEVPYLLFGK
ncbi:DUF3375 domain-containing protein [Chitinophaga ginsengisoli]|uniref:Uncharacterized protein DUF3375 n=1 Tax=Chitinophaga ginsengisoli TaxID=363837 RepID=A0A2P8GPN1_9BACT|nr:DUF3375 domain-containing protein [Chitinophaga ginsengisoli]PSL35916.1 uncharacterized protein DUF3375 [Chitinophaga ginsengisoli]